MRTHGCDSAPMQSWRVQARHAASHLAWPQHVWLLHWAQEGGVWHTLRVRVQRGRFQMQIDSGSATGSSSSQQDREESTCARAQRARAPNPPLPRRRICGVLPGPAARTPGSARPRHTPQAPAAHAAWPAWAGAGHLQLLCCHPRFGCGSYLEAAGLSQEAACSQCASAAHHHSAGLSSHVCLLRF